MTKPTLSPTHYELLEVPATATGDEIKQSFRRLAKIFHPDRHSHSTQQTQFLEKFQILSAAYEVLSDMLAIGIIQPTIKKVSIPKINAPTM